MLELGSYGDAGDTLIIWQRLSHEVGPRKERIMTSISSGREIKLCTFVIPVASNGKFSGTPTLAGFESPHVSQWTGFRSRITQASS